MRFEVTAVLTWPKSMVPGESERMHCTPSPVRSKWLACGSLVVVPSGWSTVPVTVGENASRQRERYLVPRVRPVE